MKGFVLLLVFAIVMSYKSIQVYRQSFKSLVRRQYEQVAPRGRCCFCSSHDDDWINDENWQRKNDTIKLI